MLQSGQRIGGKYQLVRQLGEGGMGVVWEATNLAIERPVAIKLMRPELTRHDQSLQRFFNEAKVCGKIRHRGIVDVLDLGRAEDGSPFLVMELLDGVELDTLMATAHGSSPSCILPIVRDAARTLELAHQHGVVHRDLKPSNLFLHRAEGRVVVKVLDFGVSKIIADAQSSKLTRTGMVLGTPAYMSPEQAGGRLVVDHRADIYSLGVILFEGLAGRLPFEGPTANAFLIDIATKDAPRVTSFRSDLHAAIDDLVAACLERHRDRRIATAAQLAERIEAVMRAAQTADELQSLDVRALAQRPGQRRPRPWSVSTLESDRQLAAPELEATLPTSGMRSAGRPGTTASPLSSERAPARIRGPRWPWALAMACLLVAVGGAALKMRLDAAADGQGAAPDSSEATTAPVAAPPEIAPVTTASAEAPSADPASSARASPSTAPVASETSANAKAQGAPGPKRAPARPASSPATAPTSPPATSKPTDVWGYD
jgi:serine/threonine-protein kinase